MNTPSTPTTTTKDQDPLEQYRIPDMHHHHDHFPSSTTPSPAIITPPFSSSVNVHAFPPLLNTHYVMDVVDIKITAFRNAIVAVKMILG